MVFNGYYYKSLLGCVQGAFGITIIVEFSLLKNEVGVMGNQPENSK
jgi:hypothetical protein